MGGKGKLAVVIGMLLMLVLLAAACGSGTSTGSNSPAATSGGTPQKGGNLTIARSADILGLDPTALADNVSIWVTEQIFDTLYTVNDDGKGVHPALATGYKVSADKRTWTFTLRSDIKFSDGRPLTSADVAFSLNRARTSTSGLGYLDSAIASVSAAGPSAVVIRTKYPWAPLLAVTSLFTNGIVPADFGGKTAAQFFKNPVGTGPFMFKSWTKGQSVVLVRNPNYWQSGKPYLDSVTYNNVPDDNTRALQLEGGQVQVDQSPPFSSISNLKGRSDVTVQLFPSTRVDMLLLNEHYAPLKDLHVRSAINFAIDRKALVGAILFGNGTPANSPLPRTLMFYDPSLPPQAPDLAKAKQELAASAYPKGFDLEYLTDNMTNDMMLGQILQQELKPLGIKVKIRTVDSNQIFTTQQKGDYQLSIEYWTMDIPDPDESAQFWLTPAGGGNSYFTYYNNPTMNKLIAASAKELDTGKRGQIYDQIQKLAMQDLPQLYLYYSPFPWALSTKVHDFFATPLGNQHLEAVWLSK